MATDPVARVEFTATIQRLEQTDSYTLLQLTNHIADYRRETGEMKTNVIDMDRKLDRLLANQANVKGRDGVILVLVMAAVTILSTVIAASIMGVIR